MINLDYIDELINMIGKGGVQEAVAAFESTAISYLNEANKLYQLNDYEECAKELHKLKGAAATVGFENLSVYAKETEVKLLELKGNFAAEWNERMNLMTCLYSQSLEQMKAIIA